MYLLRSIHPGSATYDEVRQAVTDCFYKNHQARPDPKPEEFWCLTGRDGCTPGYACVGLCWGDSFKLFSEYYLDEPIDVIFSVARSEIVEIGQFASFRGQGAGRFLLSLVLQGLTSRRHRCALLTATQQVRTLLGELGHEFEDLGPAKIERVRDRHIDWGSYYQQDPHVIVVDLGRLQNTTPEELQPPGWLAGRAYPPLRNDRAIPRGFSPLPGSFAGGQQ